MRRAARRAGPRSKYGAVPTVVDNIRFHSAKEARRYQELKLLEKAGAIKALTLQPEYPLSAATDDPEAPEEIGVYRADFSYHERYEVNGFPGWRIVVEDVKGGPRTALYRWKKKHVEAQYRIEILET